MKITDASLLKNVRYRLENQQFSYKTHEKMKLGLAGRYQILNAAVALDVLDALKGQGFPIKETAVRKAFLEAKWPGRMEILDQKPLFVIDGAHNEDAAEKLASSIDFYFTNKKII